MGVTTACLNDSSEVLMMSSTARATDVWAANLVSQVGKTVRLPVRMTLMVHL